MGIVISSTFETNEEGLLANETSLGVSVGEGMIHYVLFKRDEAGRTDLESRVFDVDPTDGLDPVGRVNAGIDLMLDAARSAGLRVGPIGVSARTATQRRRIGSGGSGPRRQIHLAADEEAVAEFLARTGQIDRFACVIVADCGDTGLSLCTVEPSVGRVSSIERSPVLSGRRIDELLADHVAAAAPSDDPAGRTRRQRARLVSACRTAKEELGDSAASAGISLNAETVEKVTAPLIDDAREVFSRYLANLRARGMQPEAVVFVGGVANLAVTRRIADGADLEVWTAPSPELATATGAAMLAGAPGISRLAFIGGRRARTRSATMMAMVAGVIVLGVMAAVAVVATLTAGTQPPLSSARTSDAATVASTRDSDWITSTGRAKSVPSVGPPPIAEPSRRELPQWATTELPQLTPTTTLTLEPNTPPPVADSTTSVAPPEPSLTPFPAPEAPPGLIPPELIPNILPPRTTAPGRVPNTAPWQQPSGTPPATRLRPDGAVPDTQQNDQQVTPTTPVR